MGLQATYAYRLEAPGDARAMNSMRERVCEADRAFIWVIHTLVRPVDSVETHVPCGRKTRTLCQNAYEVSLIHHVRRLNRGETCGIRKFYQSRFHLRTVSDRAIITQSLIQPAPHTHQSAISKEIISCMKNSPFRESRLRNLFNRLIGTNHLFKTGITISCRVLKLYTGD